MVFLLWAALATCAVSSTIASAATPPAKIDRSLWPVPLTSPAEFDRASLAENLAALAAWDELASNPVTLGKKFGLKDPQHESFIRWRAEAFARAQETSRAAAKACSASALAREFPCSLQPGVEIPTPAKVRAAVPREFVAWWGASVGFHRAVLAESARLALLFPKPTSEILTHDVHEKTGDGFPDRSFLLTFDDGPTRVEKESDSTKGTLDALRAAGINGLFFALGSQLEARAKQTSHAALQTLYEGQCVGSHAWVHTALPRNPEWKRDLEKAEAAVAAASALTLQKALQKESQKTTDAKLAIAFRPPYGERSVEQTRWLRERGAPVVLWNIDSLDWSRTMSAHAVRDRVLTLMLLRRKGIVLFHDVHPKAASFLVPLVTALRTAGVRFVDCASPD